jgi:hypothetical protein
MKEGRKEGYKVKMKNIAFLDGVLKKEKKKKNGRKGLGGLSYQEI